MRSLRQMSVLAASVLAGLTLPAIAADSEGAAARANAPATQSTAMQGMGGTVDAAAVSATFTVQDVDKATRTVTLKASDGSIEKFTCGPEVRNFDQIKQGDQVRATVVDELAVGIRQGGQAGTGSGQMIALAPKGAKPGVVMVKTDQVNAKILAIDPERRMVSLEGPAGADRTIKVSPKVDLSQIKKGDSVAVQLVRGMAITVQSPQESAEPSGAAMPPSDTQQPNVQQKEMQP